MVQIKGVQIEGVYAAVPEAFVENAEALQSLYGDNVDTVIKATGIHRRHMAPQGVTATDLCCHAAERLLADLSIDPCEIGAVVFVTFTPDHIMPFNASAAQQRLKLDEHIAAFDMNLACSGYVYGLWNSALIAKNTGKKVLLLDGDVQTAYVSQEDKATAPVLADGGSATLISPSGDGEWSFSFYTNGAGREALCIPAGGTARGIDAEALKYKEQEDGGRRRDADIYMDGAGIFRFVVQEVNQLIQTFLQELSLHTNGFRAFVPHQANVYMIRQLARRLGFDKDAVWVAGDRYGNSASATIPVTIAEWGGEKLKQESEDVLVAGFGAGLSVGIGAIQLSQNAKYKVLKYEKQEQSHG